LLPKTPKPRAYKRANLRAGFKDAESLRMNSDIPHPQNLFPQRRV